MVKWKDYNNIEMVQGPQNLKFGLKDETGKLTTIAYYEDIETITETINESVLKLNGGNKLSKQYSTGPIDAALALTIHGLSKDIKVDLLGYKERTDGSIYLGKGQTPPEVALSYVELDYANKLNYKGYTAVRFSYPEGGSSNPNPDSAPENKVVLEGTARNVYDPTDKTLVLVVEEYDVTPERIAELDKYVFGLDLSVTTSFDKSLYESWVDIVGAIPEEPEV